MMMTAAASLQPMQTLCVYVNRFACSSFAFSPLTLLVGGHGEHLACKKYHSNSL